MNSAPERHLPTFEPLEPRQLLSGSSWADLSQVDSSYTSVIIGSHQGAQRDGWGFADGDGDIITPRLTGPGWVELIFDGDPGSSSLYTIRFHDTNRRSHFEIGVKQDVDYGDGWFNCDGDFTGEGQAGLGLLDLSRVDWAGSDGIFFHGAIGTLRLSDPTEDDCVNTCPAIVVMCDPSDQLNLVAGDLTGLSALTCTGILSATVDSLSYLTIDVHRLASLDVRGDCTGAEIIADSIGQISVRGEFQATITCSGSIDEIAVSGGDASLDVTCDGAIGDIRVTGGDFYGQIVAGGTIDRVSVTSDVVREDGEAWRVGGNICSAWFEAASIGKVSVSGGDITDTDFVTTGSIGTISAQAVTDRSDGDVEVGGGSISNCTITSGGPVSRVADASGDIELPVTTGEITVSDGEAWAPDANDDSAGSTPVPEGDSPATIPAGGDEILPVTYPVIDDGSSDIPTCDPTIGLVPKFHPIFRLVLIDGNSGNPFIFIDDPSCLYPTATFTSTADAYLCVLSALSGDYAVALDGSVTGLTMVANAAEQAQTPPLDEQDSGPADGDGGESAPAAPQDAVVSQPGPIGLTGGAVETPARAENGIREIAGPSVWLIAPAFCSDVRLAASVQTGRFDPTGGDAVESHGGDLLGNRFASAAMESLLLKSPVSTVLA
ncbi:MAG: hypothetical protein NTV86_06265 [Planctomycetota bacterium]|nr:hypothetical protein [Planctomycetota bacterium]